VPAREAHYSQSVERGLGLLERFTPEHPVRGVRELARELGVSYSTTQRYVGILVALGFLKHVAGGGYRMTLGVTRLGLSTMSGVGLYAQAHDEVVELAYRVGHVAAVAVLDGCDIVLVDRVEESVRAAPTGRRSSCQGRLPAYGTALGKVLLAFLPGYARRRLLGEIVLARRASGTITSRRAMQHELSEVAESGQALAESELAEGLIAIAVPLRAGDGEVVAALGLQGHSSLITLENMVAALGSHLQMTADRISARLGYRRVHENKWYAERRHV
jgi:IclR family pca regulon transcriptional regulator